MQRSFLLWLKPWINIAMVTPQEVIAILATRLCVGDTGRWWPGCGPTEGASARAAKGFNFASDRKLPDHSGQHSWLLMELQTSQGGHAGHRWKHRPWVRQHQSWTTEQQKEVTWSFMLSTHGTRMHYGKKARGQPACCYVHVMQVGSCCATLTCTLYQSSAVHPRPWKWHPLMAVPSFSRIMWAAAEEKRFKDGRKPTKTSLGGWISL